MDTAPRPTPISRATLRAILPALFLASSWTWVIGMWFPYYLTRDFGWIAWLVFAIPNVIGAASVGLILRPGNSRDPQTWSTRSSVKLTTRHDIACMAFSVVTIAFQLYVVSFLLRTEVAKIDIPAPLVSISTAVFAALTIIFALLPWRASWFAAAVVWLFSIAMAYVAIRTSADQPAFMLPREKGIVSLTGDPHGIWKLAPAIVFGFLLCPYLDLTINRVRQDTAEPTGSIASVLGYGVFFLLMIGMTLGYAGRLIDSNTMSIYIVAHIAVQASFTAGVHLRALGRAGGFHKYDLSKPRDTEGRPTAVRQAKLRLFCFSFLFCFALFFGNAVTDLHDPRPGYPVERFFYDLIISSYGLVFPAYMYICVIPHKTLRSVRQRTRVYLWAGAVVAATPFFFLGFIGTDKPQYGLVPIGVAILLAAPYVVGPWLPRKRVLIRSRRDQ
ncbi:MAG: hypothetical protein ACIAQF_10770 [Phycisphaerales bacterium JB065]